MRGRCSCCGMRAAGGGRVGNGGAAPQLTSRRKAALPGRVSEASAGRAQEAGSRGGAWRSSKRDLSGCRLERHGAQRMHARGFGWRWPAG
eukprot:scaffold4116_cov106-Isochrysis_galbana.AAC.9